jgi:SAM-dependent methyltransferase
MTKYLNNDINKISLALGLKNPTIYSPLWNYDIIDELLDDSNTEVTELLTKIKKENEKQVFLLKNRIDMISDKINFESNFLDLGCSTGWNSFELYNRGAHSVIGVDNNSGDNSYHRRENHQLFMANNLLTYHNINDNKIKFIESDILEYLRSVEDTFDYILCFLVLHHFMAKINDESPTFRFLTNNKYLSNIGVEIIKKIKSKSRECFLQIRTKVNGPELKEQTQIIKNYLIKDIGFQSVEIIHNDKISYWPIEKEPVFYCRS